MSDDPYGGSEPTAEDCIRAGLYWFSRRDLEAARAWWERALLLEPDNSKAQECARLLQTFENKADRGNTAEREDFALELEPDPPPPDDVQIDVNAPPAPAIDPLFDRPSPEDLHRDLGSLDLDNREWAHAMRASGELPIASAFLTNELDEEVWEEEPTTLPGERSVWPPPPSNQTPSEDVELVAPEIPSLPSSLDPFDFAAASDPNMVSTTGGDRTPWDEGPSRTSVVTLDDEYLEFDAVAEPTPLPEIDKERFFGRIQDDDALVEYMRSTGDLLIRRPGELSSKSDTYEVDPELREQSWEGGTSGEIVFEDAVEMAPPKPKPKREREKAPTPQQIMIEARDRLALHDFLGVLELVETIPAHQRDDEANKLRATCRANLLKMYESKIGPTDRVPKVRLSNEEVIWLNLNHRAGFILSQVDGSVTYEDLIALSGMDRLDTVQILAELIAQGVIKA